MKGTEALETSSTSVACIHKRPVPLVVEGNQKHRDTTSNSSSISLPCTMTMIRHLEEASTSFKRVSDSLPTTPTNRRNGRSKSHSPLQVQVHLHVPCCIRSATKTENIEEKANVGSALSQINTFSSIDSQDSKSCQKLRMANINNSFSNDITTSPPRRPTMSRRSKCPAQSPELPRLFSLGFSTPLLSNLSMKEEALGNQMKQEQLESVRVVPQDSTCHDHSDPVKKNLLDDIKDNSEEKLNLTISAKSTSDNGLVLVRRRISREDLIKEGGHSIHSGYEDDDDDSSHDSTTTRIIRKRIRSKRRSLSQSNAVAVGHNDQQVSRSTSRSLNNINVTSAGTIRTPFQEKQHHEHNPWNDLHSQGNDFSSTPHYHQHHHHPFPCSSRHLYNYDPALLTPCQIPTSTPSTSRPTPTYTFHNEYTTSSPRIKNHQSTKPVTSKKKVPPGIEFLGKYIVCEHSNQYDLDDDQSSFTSSCFSEDDNEGEQ